MAKRVVLKKGDIVSITRDNHKRYIQYVDNDHYQLNGDVIYVFKRIYTSNDNPSVEGIVNDTYELVLHTTIRAGIKYNGWEKIGHSEPKDVSFVHFFSWNSDDEKLIFSKCNMYIFHLKKEHQWWYKRQSQKSTSNCKSNQDSGFPCFR